LTLGSREAIGEEGGERDQESQGTRTSVGHFRIKKAKQKESEVIGKSTIPGVIRKKIGGAAYAKRKIKRRRGGDRQGHTKRSVVVATQAAANRSEAKEREWTGWCAISISDISKEKHFI